MVIRGNGDRTLVCSAPAVTCARVVLSSGFGHIEVPAVENARLERQDVQSNSADENRKVPFDRRLNQGDYSELIPGITVWWKHTSLVGDGPLTNNLFFDNGSDC